MYSHLTLISVVLAFLSQGSLSQLYSGYPGQPSYGNVAYCIVGSPIILRCEGPYLRPGNCDDNTDEPPFGALCIESSPSAGNAFCLAVGSPKPAPFTPVGGLGPSPTSTSIALPSVTSSVTPMTLAMALVTTTAANGSVYTVIGVLVNQGHGNTTTRPCKTVISTDTAGSTYTETVIGTTVLPAALQKPTSAVATGSMGAGSGTSPSPAAFKGIAAPIRTAATGAAILILGVGVLLFL